MEPYREHRWDSGWIPDAIDFLVADLWMLRAGQSARGGNLGAFGAVELNFSLSVLRGSVVNLFLDVHDTGAVALALIPVRKLQMNLFNSLTSKKAPSTRLFRTPQSSAEFTN